MFPPIIGKNSVFMPLSQNEDALVDPSTVFISIERLCSPAAILVRAIQKSWNSSSGSVTSRTASHSKMWKRPALAGN